MTLKLSCIWTVLLMNNALQGSAGPATAAGAGAQAKEQAQKYSVHIFHGKHPEKKYQDFRAITFSPNGERLVAADYGYAGLHNFLVDPETGKLTLAKVTLISHPWSVAFFPDGNNLASASYIDNFISLSDFLGNRTEKKYPTNGVGARSLVISPNGLILVTANNQSDNISVFSVDDYLQHPPKLEKFPHPLVPIEKPLCAAFSPNGKFLAVSGSGKIAVFSIDYNSKALSQIQGSPFIMKPNIVHIEGKELAVPKDPSFITFSPDGNFLAVILDLHEIQLFHANAQTGTLAPAQKSIKVTNDGSMLHSLAFSPNGRLLIAVLSAYSKPGLIAAFSVDRQNARLTPISQIETIENAQNCAISHNGRLLAVGGTGIAMYEVDEATDFISPITGNTLNYILKKQIAQETLFTSQAGNAPILPGGEIKQLLEDYIVGQEQPTQQQIKHATQNAQEEAQKKAIADAIALTKKQGETMRVDADALFKAIQEGDAKAVTQHLTPFTINARDNEGKTPLIAAAYYQKADITLQILVYKGIKQKSRYDKTIERANALAMDTKGNTALLYAIMHEDNKLINILKNAMLKARAEKSVQ